jgi:multidrug efflux system membrane fusion protein
MWISGAALSYPGSLCSLDTTLTPEVEPQEQTKLFRVILDPYYRTQLSAEVEFPVSKINFRMGDSFNEGDILILQDPTVLEANRLKAEAILARAKTEFSAKEQLYREKIASLFELKEAEANVASAYADVILANKNLRATSIKAPYSGKVVELAVEEHELPQPGKKIVEIIDDSILRARLLLPSSYYTKVKVGDPISIKIRETGETVTGKITRVGSVIDPSSSTFKAEAEIDNSDDKLRVGMTGLTQLSQTQAAHLPKQDIGYMRKKSGTNEERN